MITLKKCSKVKADCAEYISSIFCHAIINAVWTRIKIHVLKVIVLCDDDEIECEKCEYYYHLHKTKHFCVLGDGCLTKNDQKCVQCRDGYHLWIWM